MVFVAILGCSGNSTTAPSNRPPVTLVSPTADASADSEPTVEKESRVSDKDLEQMANLLLLAGVAAETAGADCEKLATTLESLAKTEANALERMLKLEGTLTAKERVVIEQRLHAKYGPELDKSMYSLSAAWGTCYDNEGVRIVLQKLGYKNVPLHSNR